MTDKSAGQHQTNPVAGVFICLVPVLIAALLGMWASTDARDYYEQLIRPPWAPPGWLFGPVWSLLYGMIALAAWLVWSATGWAGARIPLTYFLLQLVLNALWSWFFFAWQQGMFAMINIIALLCFILATMISFWRHRPLASMLLWPYFGWVAFAAALNYATWQLNPSFLG